MDEKLFDLFEAETAIPQNVQNSANRAVMQVKQQMQQKKYEQNTWKGFKRAVVLAGISVVLLGTGVYAANHYSGIFDFLKKEGKALPEEAADMVRTDLQQESVGNAQVTFTVKEAVCDREMLYVVIEAAAKERGKYLFLPQMVTPDDPLENIGLAGEQTVQEYADSKGLTLLYVSAGLDMDMLDMYTGSEDHVWVSDDVMDIMVFGSKGNTAEQLEVSAAVCAYESGASDMWRENMRFTVQDLSSEQITRYVPEDGMGGIPNAFLTIREVQVKKTELGAYIEIIYTKSREDVEDCVFHVLDTNHSEWDNFIFSSGVLENEDGTRSQKFYYGKQDISDEIMIEPYDLELDYRYEGIVVERIP